MRYTKQSFSVELVGTRHGYLWNGSKGYQEFEKTLSDNALLRPVVQNILHPDFQDAKLDTDSYIMITLIKPNRRIIRYFDITLFESISDLVERL